MDYCPIKGESKTLICLTLQNPEINAGSMGHLVRKRFSLNDCELCLLVQLLFPKPNFGYH